MVNTFLVHSNFSQSASFLDRARLGKQRVEAMQILHILDNLLIIRLKSRIQQKHYSSLQSYISALVQWYKEQPFHFQITYLPNNKFHVEQFKKQDWSIDEIPCGANQRVIKIGFSNHSAVRMWYGYRFALMDYINAHIKEWIKRGYTNTMQLYDVPLDYPRPKWTWDHSMHENHRGALINKELDRGEAPWYVYMQDFLKAKKFTEYVWPR
jgi:hypothetical protein